MRRAPMTFSFLPELRSKKSMISKMGDGGKAPWSSPRMAIGGAGGAHGLPSVGLEPTTWIGDDDHILAAIEVAAAGDDAADRWGARRQALPGGRGREEKYRTGGQSIHDVLLRAQVRDVALTVKV